MPSTSWRLPISALSTPRPSSTAMHTTRHARHSGLTKRLDSASIAGDVRRDGTQWHSSKCSMPFPKTMHDVGSWSMPSWNGRTRRAACGIRWWTLPSVRATTWNPPVPPCSPTPFWKPIAKVMSARNTKMPASRPTKASSRTSSRCTPTRPSRWPTAVL